MVSVGYGKLTIGTLFQYRGATHETNTHRGGVAYLRYNRASAANCEPAKQCLGPDSRHTGRLGEQQLRRGVGRRLTPRRPYGDGLVPRPTCRRPPPPCGWTATTKSYLRPWTRQQPR